MSQELVLIVEDNEKNRKLIRDLLQAKGYQTIESDSAEEGIKLAEEKKPALILMDIQLPGMDGITAMKQLKAAPGYPHHSGHGDHGIGDDVQSRVDVG